MLGGARPPRRRGSLRPPAAAQQGDGGARRAAGADRQGPARARAAARGRRHAQRARRAGHGRAGMSTSQSRACGPGRSCTRCTTPALLRPTATRRPVRGAAPRGPPVRVLGDAGACQGRRRSEEDAQHAAHEHSVWQGHAYAYMYFKHIMYVHVCMSSCECMSVSVCLSSADCSCHLFCRVSQEHKLARAGQVAGGERGTWSLRAASTACGGMSSCGRRSPCTMVRPTIPLVPARTGAPPAAW